MGDKNDEKSLIFIKKQIGKVLERSKNEDIDKYIKKLNNLTIPFNAEKLDNFKKYLLKLTNLDIVKTDKKLVKYFKAIEDEVEKYKFIAPPESESDTESEKSDSGSERSNSGSDADSDEENSDENNSDSEEDNNSDSDSDSDKKPKKFKEVKLMDSDQEEHYERMVDLLNKQYYCCDFSGTGAGKTHLASKIAQNKDFNFKAVIIICPKGVKATWFKASKEYGLPLIILDNNELSVITYETLRGMKNGITKTGLLFKDKTVLEPEPGKTNKKTVNTYKVTKMLDKLIKKGCLFIFDEFHKTKDGTTVTHLSAKAIILRVKKLSDRGESNSKVLMATASPFTDPIQVLNFASLVGIITSDKLFVNNRGGFKLFDDEGNPLGYEQIREYAENINEEKTLEAIEKGLNPKKDEEDNATGRTTGGGDTPAKMNSSASKPIKPTKTKKLLPKQKLAPKNVKAVAYSIFVDVILPTISSSMPPISLPFKTIITNDRYIISEARSKLLKKAIEELAAAVRYDASKDSFGSGGGGSNKGRMGSVITCLMKIETFKLEIFARKAIDYLEMNDTNKVVIILSYVSDMKTLEDILYKYNPQLLYGKTKEDDRTDIINSFSEPNGNSRLIIGQLTVVSLGIELDDKYGGFDRHVFVNPNFRAIDTHQVNARFYRKLTKSPSHIHYVYVKGENKEQNITDAYARKSKVMSETLTKQTEAGVLFPGQYPLREEEEIIFPKIKYHKESLKFEPTVKNRALYEVCDEIHTVFERDRKGEEYEDEDELDASESEDE